MTVETLDAVTVQARSSPGISLLGSRSASAVGQLASSVWTALSDAGQHEPAADDLPLAPGTPALLVVEGVARALTVRISEGPDGVFVADIETTVFGTGDTLPQAVADLKAALHAHLAVLSEEGVLAPNLQHELEVLRAYFMTP